MYISKNLIILISHYISAIIIGVFNKKKVIKNNIESNNTSIIKKNFIYVLKKSIQNTIETLFLILGIITTCIIITCIIDNIIHINDNYKFIYGFVEITQGLKYLSLSNFSIQTKSIIASTIISFGGFCIHAQVFSIINNKKIRYLPYLLSRILHSLLSIVFTFIIIVVLY